MDSEAQTPSSSSVTNLALARSAEDCYRPEKAPRQKRRDEWGLRRVDFTINILFCTGYATHHTDSEIGCDAACMFLLSSDIIQVEGTASADPDVDGVHLTEGG